MIKGDLFPEIILISKEKKIKEGISEWKKKKRVKMQMTD